MAQLRVGESKAERELQAHVDELAILQHAERLKMIAGYERAVEVLASAQCGPSLRNARQLSSRTSIRAFGRR